MVATNKNARIETKLEVAVIPVSDVDRAKAFYVGLGWRLDADFDFPAFRGLQLTPPGSEASIIFGRNVTTATPGSLQGLVLVVEDLAAARADLIERGADVSEISHGGKFFGPLPHTAGPDPDGRSYFSYASFSDPDGNQWLLQEVKVRAPGRVEVKETTKLNVAALTDLLREAETRHGVYAATAPKHEWSDWYAAYMVAREQGKTSDVAANEASLQMAIAA